jgi:pimeloyl-ACP methyl ester carboxylesterase
MINQFVDVDGVETRCLVAGDEGAPPLILVHGITLTSEIWVRNMDALGRDFRVIAPDLLGHGFTRPPRGQEAVGIPRKIDHLLRLADTLGFDRFALSGSSYGALIAANVYLEAPQRITKLVVNGSGSAFNTEPQLVEFIDRLYAIYKPTLTTSSPQMWRERMTGTFYDPKDIPGELPTILPIVYAQPWMSTAWEHTIQTMRDPAAFRPFRILERLEEIKVDTLIVWGRNDKGGVYESAVEAARRMPKARLVAFDKCGHLPMLEHPAEYNQTIRDFLKA